jgi:signal transduction histidine kinase
MDVAWLAKKTPEQTPALKDKFQNIIGLLDNSNQSVRRILSELRPSILDDFSLLEALKWHGKQFSANTGILLEIESNENDFKVKEEIATCIYRIFQEALTNVSRYARAKKVLTTIQLSKDSISVTVEDDGVGFDQSQMQTKKTFGILGMKERVRSLSGVLEIISSPGKGTKINFRLPK